jgi:hypothetical protein
MAKTNGKPAKSTDLMVIDENTYPALAKNSEQKQLLMENLGGEGITAKDLEVVKVPAGGNTSWMVTDENGQQVSVPHLEGIIVFTKVTRSFWKEAYTGGSTPPDCFSPDNLNGIGTPGGNCFHCALNAFGTAPNGRAKACSEKRLIFMVMPGQLLPVLVRIPASSLEAAKKYLIRLATVKQKATHAVVTRLKLTQEKNADGIVFSQVAFESAGDLSPEHAAAAKAYADSIMPALETTVTEEAKQADTDDMAKAA